MAPCFDADQVRLWRGPHDLDPAQAERSGRAILETCAERDALLLAAHFSAPHVFRVVQRGNGLAALSGT